MKPAPIVFAAAAREREINQSPALWGVLTAGHAGRPPGGRDRSEWKEYMLQLAGLIYGMLASFILSSASRNHKTGRPHPPMLVYAGYLLCGLSMGAALALPLSVLLGYDILPHLLAELA
jgi:hypothetical protein